LASKRVAEAGGLHHGAENRLHAMEFLEYAYLQTGRLEDAKAVVVEASTVLPTDVDPRYPDMWASVETRFAVLLALETKDWTAAEHLKPVSTTVNQEAILLAHAEAAAYGNNRELADATLSQFEQLRSTKAQLPESTVEAEIHAWIDFALGRPRDAVALMQPVADRQAKAGKNEIEIPAREMLADMLLFDGRFAEALAQYQKSLRTDPNRFNTIWGAGQAAAHLGRNDLAKRYYRILAANCDHPNGAATEKLSEARMWGRKKERL